MKKKSILIIVLVAALVLLLGGLIAFIVLRAQPSDASKSKAKFNDAISISEDLSVAGWFPYTGKFVEDGSDELVENIASLVLINHGETDYQYLEFSVTSGGDTYLFTASSILAGTQTKILNKAKKPCPADAIIESGEVTVKAPYQTEPTLCEEAFQYSLGEGTLTVKNISGKDIAGDISVFYKNKTEEGDLGGITYRVIFHGMKNGEMQQRASEHIGKIVCITYDA